MFLTERWGVIKKARGMNYKTGGFRGERGGMIMAAEFRDPRPRPGVDVAPMAREKKMLLTLRGVYTGKNTPGSRSGGEDSLDAVGNDEEGIPPMVERGVETFNP